MLMGLELLEEEGIKNSLSSSASQLFEMVFENTQRLQSDVENALQYLQLPRLIQSGMGLNLSELEPLVSQISSDLGLKKVTVSDQTEARRAHLLLSKQAVELILREILGNAKKFHPEQSPTVQIELTAPHSDKQVSIQIRDNGVSLSPQQLAQLWTPYYQVDKYVTGEVSGMGLGLSKVALLVWQVGGKCRIYNQSEGLGIIVELILPLKWPEIEIR
jgi:K+-sensing histidine kinase KdpD